MANASQASRWRPNSVRFLRWPVDMDVRQQLSEIRQDLATKRLQAIDAFRTALSLIALLK